MGFNITDPGAGGGGQFKAKDHLGSVCIFIEPVKKTVNTQYGEAEAASCKYAVDVTKDEAVKDALVFGTIIADQIAHSPGVEIVVGVIGQGQARAGQSPAWLLNPADDAQRAAALDWLKANAEQTSTGRVVIRGVE